MKPVLLSESAADWDDSDCIATWDLAVAEYKKYHSIKATEGASEQPIRPPDSTQDPADGQPLDVEDKLEEERPESQPAAAKDEQGGQTNAEEQSGVSEQASEIPAPPEFALNMVEDEGLKNLMMSWYYAGYYTGLRQGQMSRKEQKQD